MARRASSAKKKDTNVEVSGSEEDAGQPRKKSAPARPGKARRDPSAQESAMAELENLNHESAMSSKKALVEAAAPPPPPPPPPPAPALETDDTENGTERVREMERKRKERDEKEARDAQMQSVLAENKKLRQQLKADKKNTDSAPTKPKKIRTSAERREKIVRAVFVMRVLSL